MVKTSTDKDRQARVWIIGDQVDAAMLERAGDARRVADQLHTGVGAVVLGVEVREAGQLIAHGVDMVCFVAFALGVQSAVATAAAVLAEHDARLVLAAGDCHGREWAALLAVRLGWQLVSPALMAQVRHGGIEVTGLHRSGRLARNIQVEPHQGVILTMRPGVAEALQADLTRRGELIQIDAVRRPEWATQQQLIPADPASVDIRYAERLVAGGRGVGSREGFDRLRRFAEKIGAGIAASRMAVDLGWVAPERQVGQTGKTVSPDLYIACGISGARHHLAGMSGARHIVAINTDPEAPIFQVAHLGLVADLYEVLARLEEDMAE
jgi:electron transfer flavoprotein alpha subunit